MDTFRQSDQAMLKDRLPWLSGLSKAEQKVDGPFRAMDCETPFEPPTCDTFTWFRGCFFFVDLDLRRMDIYGLSAKVVSGSPSTSTGESFPGSLRRRRSKIRFRAPFDVGGGAISGLHLRSNVCLDMPIPFFQDECMFSCFPSPVGEDSDDLLKSIRDLFGLLLMVTFESMDVLDIPKRLLLDHLL